MAVEVETLGWVGLEFSPNGDMVDSDIMMAWVIDGEVSITDRFAVSRSLPEEDSQQDIQLINGYEEDGKTVIQFCRLVNIIFWCLWIYLSGVCLTGDDITPCFFQMPRTANFIGTFFAS